MSAEPGDAAAITPDRGRRTADAARPGKPSRVPRRWLMPAQLAWLAVAAFALGLFVASVPTVYERQLHFTTNPIVQKNLRELGLSGAHYALIQTTFQIAFGAVCCIVAGVIFWRRSNEVMALFVAVLLLAFGASPDVSWLDSLPPAVALPAEFLRFLGSASVAAFFFLFPDGRFVPHWTRWLALYWVVATVFGILVPAPPPAIGLFRPLSLLGMLAAMAFAQVYRYRRVSGPVERQQTKWLVFGVTGVVVPGVLGGLLSLVFPALFDAGTLLHLAGSSVVQSAVLLIPVSLGMATLRYRLWDVDPIINRTLVYAALTASIVGIYSLIVGGLGTLLQTRANLAISLLATGFVAVLFQPLQVWLQRGVNRLMYGERDDPYAVISRLGRRLETTLAPDAILPTIVETVREALKLPYAAIALETNDDPPIPGGDAASRDEPSPVHAAGEALPAAASGTPMDDLLRLPLLFQGDQVGLLLLGPRAFGETWSPADRRLLADFARQAGIAVHAVRLTAELQHARTQLVTAREEERRRLRRDLHDGLGPALGSLALEADTARDLVRSDPAEAEALLSDIIAQGQAAVADIRRLVYNLRPPALDDLGLVAALRSQAAHYEHSGLQVVVDAPDQLPALPAAVEVAGYRIVHEALANVLRHADARTCTVRLAVGGTLELVIVDDGCGLPPDRRAGVGLASMRERAEELGGTCSVEPGPAGGTCVHARLPLA